jgi:hypothetical protein
MNGFLLALGACFFLTFISGGFIWYARQISGPASVAIIQTGMFVKFMLGASISLLVIKFAAVNVTVFGLTVGIYSCVAFPIVAFFMVKKDISK